jgi:hypothetical protein
LEESATEWEEEDAGLEVFGPILRAAEKPVKFFSNVDLQR